MTYEEKEFYTHSFDTYEELTAWLDSHKDDNRQVYYYGFWENFDGDFCTIADIRKDADCSWFEDGAAVEIYEEA